MNETSTVFLDHLVLPRIGLRALWGALLVNMSPTPHLSSKKASNGLILSANLFSLHLRLIFLLSLRICRKSWKWSAWVKNFEYFPFMWVLILKYVQKPHVLHVNLKKIRRPFKWSHLSLFILLFGPSRLSNRSRPLTLLCIWPFYKKLKS